MTTVLVLVRGRVLEALLADLVAFAGFHPVFVRDDESPSAAVCNRRVDLVLVDADLPPTVVTSCAKTAHAAEAAVVYCASELTAAELRAFADARQSPHFALPNGPKLLGVVLAQALARVGKQGSSGAGAPPEAIAVALRAMARAHYLDTSARAAFRASGTPLHARDELGMEARNSRELLRSAVLDYLDTLRDRGVEREIARTLVGAAIRESIEAAGVPEMLATIGRDANDWVDEVYRAA